MTSPHPRHELVDQVIDDGVDDRRDLVESARGVHHS